ncbi:MAG TPA: murein biosynthesis integral membrane protein MurJ [Gemmatimonadaceae bacterium]|nr:murein biosynthesis integral membrane protein MurJ [Gemmatimonadaceae bacterium]
MSDRLAATDAVVDPTGGGADDAPPPAARADRPGPARPDGGARHALLVGAGILLSRLFGLARTKVLNYYLGLGDAADAYSVASRIPNILQNLFGEGVLSASFIPVYAGLLGARDEEEAGRTAGAVFALLALVTALLVLLGLLFTPLIVTALASGFTGAKRELTIRLVRIFFPGVGLLVLSAWCLGVLNSHRRFLLSYSAPVLWNVAIIASLVIAGGGLHVPAAGELPRIARLAAWGAVVGSALQFGVQLPTVLRVARGLRLWLGRHSAHVRTVLRNFVPAILGRGVVQLSILVDLTIASWLPTGAAMGLTNATIIYNLPVSLFGMSVSAAELPAMSSITGDRDAVAATLRARLAGGLRRVAFFVVPSAAAFLAFGDLIAGLLLQGGRFSRADSVYTWGILAGSAVGLLAATLGRLYSSTFYALRDTRTPLRFAAVRLLLVAALGVPAALALPQLVGVDQLWGAAGLTASAGVAGWVEFFLLRRALERRVGRARLEGGLLPRLWALAAVAAAAGWGLKLLLGVRHVALTAVVVLGVYGALYLALSAVLGVGEARGLVGRLRRRTGG